MREVEEEKILNEHFNMQEGGKKKEIANSNDSFSGVLFKFQKSITK